MCRSNELSLDILEKETDMAVRCEPDHCGLEVLQERQDHQEVRRTIPWPAFATASETIHSSRFSHSLLDDGPFLR